MATSLETDQRKPNNVSENKEVFETSNETAKRKDSLGHGSRTKSNKSSEDKIVNITPLEDAEPKADVLLPNQPTPTAGEHKSARNGGGQVRSNHSTNSSTGISLHPNQITQSEELSSSEEGKQITSEPTKAGVFAGKSREHQEIETSAKSKNIHHRSNTSKNGSAETDMPSQQPKASKVPPTSAKVKDTPFSKNGPLQSNQLKSSKVGPNSAKGKDTNSRPVLSKNGPTDAGLLSGQPKVSKAVSNFPPGKDVATLSKDELKSASVLNNQPTPSEVGLTFAKDNDASPLQKLSNDSSINDSTLSDVKSNSTKESDPPHGRGVVSKNIPMESGLPLKQPTLSEVGPNSVKGKQVSTSNPSKTGSNGSGLISNQLNKAQISSNSTNNLAAPPHQNPPTKGTEEGAGSLPKEQSKVRNDKQTAQSSNSKNTELRSAATKWKSKLSVHGTTDSERRKSSGEVPLLLQERSDSTVVSIDGESPRNHVTLNVSGDDEAGDSPYRKLSLGDFVTQDVETTKGPEKWELLEGSPNGLAKSLPYIPVSLAYTCLLLNVVIPGSGKFLLHRPYIGRAQCRVG